MQRIILFVLAFPLLILQPATSPPIERILFVGNSITLARPSEPLGWHGLWGMAATQADRDYKHRLQLMLSAKQGHVPEIGMISADIHRWRLAEPVLMFDGRTVAEFAPDLVIVQMGDNASLEADYGEWLAAYEAVAGWAAGARYVALGKWGGREGNAQEDYLQQAATATGMQYIRIRDLHTVEHEATGYADRSVAWHPNDAGMQLIAERIMVALVEDAGSGTIPPVAEWWLWLPVVTRGTDE